MHEPCPPLGPEMIGFLIVTIIIAALSVGLPVLAFWLAVTA